MTPKDLIHTHKTNYIHSQGYEPHLVGGKNYINLNSNQIKYYGSKACVYWPFQYTWIKLYKLVIEKNYL